MLGWPCHHGLAYKYSYPVYTPLEVPDLDAALGCCAQPVTVGREDQAVDHISGVE